MATISITIPDAQLQRVITALCARPYVVPAMPTPNDPPNGVMAKQIVVDWVRANVLAHEAEIAKTAVLASDVSSLVT